MYIIIALLHNQLHLLLCCSTPPLIILMRFKIFNERAFVFRSTVPTVFSLLIGFRPFLKKTRRPEIFIEHLMKQFILVLNRVKIG